MPDCKSPFPLVLRSQHQGLVPDPSPLIFRSLLPSPLSLHPGRPYRMLHGVQGSPLEQPFGEFVAAARVTQLGLVPALVRTWRASGCMQARRLLSPTPCTKVP